ncbi:MAG: hypothetical protein ACM35E_02905 [Deltaproteobacteria bacterium]
MVDAGRNINYSMTWYREWKVICTTEMFRNPRSPTKKEGAISSTCAPIVIPAAGGNPGLVNAELAWIPAFAGMTEELMERRNLRRFFTRREETLWAA